MYPVRDYLEMLKAADRADNTIILYGATFRSYAKFMEVPVDEIHDHLAPENSSSS